MAILRDLSIWYSFIHIFILFQSLYEPRYSRRRTVIIAAAVLVPLIAVNFGLFLWLGHEGYGTLMLLTLTFPQGILYWILAKHRDGRFFFTLCLVDTLALEIFYVTNILNHYLTPDTYIVMFVTRLVAYPLIDLWTIKRLRPLYLNIQKHVKKDWGIFALIGGLFYVSVTLLMTYPSFITERPVYLPVLGLQFILMPVTYIYIVKTIGHQKKIFEMSAQEDIMKLQVSNVVTRMEELGAAAEAFRKERHDFRHKLKAIASLVETHQYEELERVIARYEGDIQKTQVVRYCQTPIIDAVLSVYIRQAKAADIDVKFGFAFPDTFKANESELATALANAIENAINACEKLPVGERRMEIKVLSRPKFVIMVRNTFDGNVEFDDQGIPQTKADGHGFGTRSIAAFCENVGGYCQFEAQDGTFSVYMHLK